MKQFQIFATVIAVVGSIVAVWAGPVAATPITLALKGTIIDSVFGPRDEPVYTTGGGIFAAGQAFRGSLIYDPMNLSFSSDNGKNANYFGVVSNVAFSIATAGGPFAAELSSGGAFACRSTPPDCSTLGSQDTYQAVGFVDSLLTVNGQSLSSAGIALFGVALLDSTALLSGPEFLALIAQAQSKYLWIGVHWGRV